MAPGIPPTLSSVQVARLRALIVRSDPRQFRFELAFCTRDMIAELIERKFNATSNVSAIGRLLRRLKLPPQRPVWTGYRADPVRVDT